MTANAGGRPALGLATTCLMLILSLTLAAPASGQGANTISVLQTGLSRLDFLDPSGSSVGFAVTAGVPVVGARSANGSIWVGTDTPSRLLNITPTGFVAVDVPLPDTPSGIAIDASGNVWIAQFNIDQLRVHNAAGTFLNTFAVGTGPRGVTVAANGAVWVANSLSGSVSRVTSGLVFTFPTGGTPYDIVARTSGGVWVSNLIGNSVQLLSAAGVVTDTVAVGLSPQGLAIDEQERLWVAASGASAVYMISGGSNATTVYTVGANPRGVAIDGDGRAWVACQGNNSVHRIDPRLGSNVAFPGLSQVVIAGDCSGLARARLVDPNGDVDADTIPNGQEIALQCNPFDASLPEIGRVTPSLGSIEGGVTLTVEGCGFSAITTPQLFLGATAVTPLTIVDNFQITAPVPTGVVTAAAVDTRLVDGVVEQDVLPASFRFTGNPGQAWMPGSGSNEWLRIPVTSDGTRGTTSSINPSFNARAIAVDEVGGIWLVDGNGSNVERRTSDGVVTDSWSVTGATLGGIAIDIDGSAWVTQRGTVPLPGTLVHHLTAGSPTITSVTVGAMPVAVAVGRNGDVWVSNSMDDSVSRIRNGTDVTTFAVGDDPYGIAVDRRGHAWVATRGDGMLHEVDTDTGVLNSVAVGLQPAGVAIAGNDSLWVTLEGSASVARIDPTTVTVTATYPTAPAPRAVAIDGADAIWVLHASSGDARRYAVNGVLLDSFAMGLGGVEPGDFIGLIPTFFHHPSNDHDADGVCTGAEFQNGGEPFHPDVVPAVTLYFAEIEPASGVMVGGSAITVTGCGLDSGNLNVLIGGNPVTDLLVVNGSMVTGTLPASTNLGAADIVVTANAGSAFSPNAFTYHTSPVSGLNCVQDGVPVVLTWTEEQLYDNVIITRNGLPLVSVPGGLEAFADLNPIIGPNTYVLTGELTGELSTSVSCNVDAELPAPANLTCAQQTDAIVLSWTNIDVYDNIIIERDGFPLATLPGTSESYVDTLPALGNHDYDVHAVRGAFMTTVVPCSATFSVLAPTQLTCTPDFGSVTLTWMGTQPYGFVRIYRDAVLLTELPGDPGSYIDTTVDEGAHDYEIAGVLQGTESSLLGCSVIVPVPAITNLACTSAIFDVSLTWANALPDYDGLRLLRDNLEIATLPGSATSFDDLGLALGDYDYTIVANKNGTDSVAVACTATVNGPIFIRGDVNADGNVDIGDPVAVLGYLFGGSPAPPCLDAGDVNDDGTVNVADAVYDLTYLFSMGAAPLPPFPTPGPDPTLDAVGCDTSL